jgi:hypothetical protein
MLEIDLITQRLEDAGIVYCLVGGLAAIAYGRPRLTLDADLVVALAPRDVPRLPLVFPEADYYLPPAEVLLAEIERESRGHFNILHQHSALRADCYLPGKSALAHWELRNRRRLEGSWGASWFSPPEAIIVHKLIFYREGRSEKHLDDIRAMLVTGTPPDFAILRDWIDRLGLAEEWELVQPGT